VVFWVAGFDVIYACQDLEFDKEAGLKSIPVALGLTGALRLSRIFHCLTVALLVVFALGYSVGPLFWMAIALTTGMLIYEHRLIQGDKQSPIRLDKVNEAFFTVNGRISVAVFALVLLDKWLAGPPGL
jgi:4-hydroxybenzoate polyprenyltransferase